MWWRVLNVAAIVSLALLAVSLIQGARSHYRQGFNSSLSGQHYGAYFHGADGRLYFGVSWGNMFISGTSVTIATRDIVRTAGIEVQLVQVISSATPTRQVSIALYAWQAALLTGALPAMQFYRWRRPRSAERIKRGLCSRCGYDLRATPDRCPECGTAVASGTRAEVGAT